jgi:DNA-binding MarR family transcriptional regulator
MHPVGFAIKQAHLSMLRFSRSETAEVGLTPARLDMLRVVLERCGRVRQSALRRLLGVCNSVVSIMVRSLERLGFVVRHRCWNDRRTLDVILTARGRYALRRVFYTAVIEGFLELTLISIFVKEKVPRARWEVRIDRLISRLQMIRDAFGIGATEYNPWDATDDDHPFYFAAVRPNPNRLDLVLDPDLDSEVETDDATPNPNHADEALLDGIPRPRRRAPPGDR